MPQKKIIIKNRRKQKIAVIIEKNPWGKGLAFVMHGLGGNKNQPHIKTMGQAFFNNGYTVVRFDTTNTFGESDGKYEDATVTNYYHDLEDVIKWAKKQSWFQQHFVLAGHSLGASCTAYYAENHPKEVKAIAPISVMLSGKLSIEAHGKKKIENWKKTGWLIQERTSQPGTFKKLKWSHMKDRLKYDLLKKVKKLNMPVLLVVGQLDTSTPLKHQKILFNRLPTIKKELYVINGSHHTFRKQKHLVKLKSIFNRWIKSIS